MKYTVKEILRNTAVLLDIADKLDCTDADDADTKLFVKLLNLVSVSLAARLPLTYTETVRTNADGDVFYRALTRAATKMISVRDANGSLRALRLSDRLRTGAADCEVTLTYAYRPDAVGLDDETAFDAAEVPETVIVYALAAEYCLVMSMYDAAEQWQTRFEREYRRCVPPQTARLPARSFV